MAQLLIRDLDPSVVDKIKARAQRHGRSLQGELKTIVMEAARSAADPRALAARIRKRFAGRKYRDSARLIAEDRRR
ncbi:MAG: Arc family DNA-binding protein [Myxococcales bacterium]|nr:Arc family DNA-binding protein [Myxococcales bacterium]